MDSLYDDVNKEFIFIHLAYSGININFYNGKDLSKPDGERKELLIIPKDPENMGLV